jgi:ribulose-phosphate 3-epimerase
VLDIVDYVLVMSVNPGFGGQLFIPRSLDKVRQLERLRKERGLDFAIEIDGGITAENVGDVAKAGANWLVIGSSVFGKPDPGDAFRDLQRKAEEALLVRV